MRAAVLHMAAGWEREAQVVNVGMGGACLLVSEQLAVGDRVTLSFLAPTLWDPLAIPARVVWTLAPDPPIVRAGLAFEPTEAAAIFALFELVATLAY